MRLCIAMCVAMAAAVPQAMSHDTAMAGAIGSPMPMESAEPETKPTGVDATEPGADHSAHSGSEAGKSDHDHGMDMEPSPMSMEHHHGRPILDNPNLEPQQRLYWQQYNSTTFFTAAEGSKPELYTHAVLTVVAWAVLPPITMLLSGHPRAQWLYVPLQTVQSAVAVVALVFLGMYATTAPHLYPNNFYSKMSWGLLIAVIVQWVAMAVRAISAYLGGSPNGDEATYMLSNLRPSRSPSRDSGQGSSTEYDSEEDHIGDAETEEQTPRAPRSSALVKTMARSPMLTRLTDVVGGVSSTIYHALTYPLVAAGVGYVLLATATGFRLGMGHNVYALLAHFIKGCVFVVLGFFELSRYFGALAAYGMAWNSVVDPVATYARFQRPEGSRKFGVLRKLRFWPDAPSMEYWQSFMIWFYGSTNVFLEHLGNTDGVWSHKDLQHLSIAFMFLGGGLCGMVLESASVRRALGIAFGFGDEMGPPHRRIRTYSLNPMPAFTVFWTGALMSRHEQETELSTAVHVQWGTMLSLAAVLRLGTLALLTLRPRGRPVEGDPDSIPPQRPFTELLVSFCLICGGLIFMSSNRETVEAMIYRGYDSMFLLNISVGITTLLMSYATLAMVVRGLAIRR